MIREGTCLYDKSVMRLIKLGKRVSDRTKASDQIRSDQIAFRSPTSRNRSLSIGDSAYSSALPSMTSAYLTGILESASSERVRAIWFVCKMICVFVCVVGLVCT